MFIKMKLFGVDCDYEVMIGDEVMRRLELGYYVFFWNFFICFDVRKILQELYEKGFCYYDYFFYMIDGVMLNFYKGGMINELICIVLEEGVLVIDVYNMVLFNIVKYY